MQNAHRALVIGAAALATSLGCATAAFAQSPPVASTAPVSTPLPPTIPAPVDAAFPGVITLDVDATDLERRIVRVKEVVPVGATGRFTLLYPRWLPGTHGPNGNPNQLAGLVVRTRAGERLEWQRDAIDPQAFHVEVPAGAGALALEYQHLVPQSESGGGGRVTITPRMLNLQWISLALYPAGHHSDRIRYRASVKLPAGWQAATGLRVASRNDASNTVSYQEVSLTTLVDSPIFAGRHFRRVELDASAGQSPIALNLVADDEAELKADDKQIQAHKDLVTQADRLFGVRPYRQYDFLLAITEEMTRIGLEHHESSENAVKHGYFKDWDKKISARELLPHEYVHSWNGKFRRPADLLTPNFNVPMRNSLLWVYEGQTQYWGRVLTARSALATVEQTLDRFAQTAANYEARPGRAWRALQDTTNVGITGGRGSEIWQDWQRSADYYDEATLIWLDADTLIREKTGGAKSLDDFARAFFGVTPQRAPDGAIQPMPYDFAEVVRTLNAVTPHDWSAFLRARLDTHDRPPFDGLTRAGWKLAWSETPSPFQKATEGEFKFTDFTYSIGLSLGEQARISSVRWDGPAYKAGIAPSSTLVAVNGKTYKSDALATAITANKDGSRPIELLLKTGDDYRTVKLDWRGGLRFPKLERIDGTPDRLTPILTAK